jgi:cold shock CspA family protein
MQTWKSGSVLWFNLGKGYGLIRPNNPEDDDVSFNVSSIFGQNVELANSGTQVEYLEEQGATGMQAVSVRIL